MIGEEQESSPKEGKKTSFKVRVHFLHGLSNCAINVTFQAEYKEFTITDRSANCSLNSILVSAA